MKSFTEGRTGFEYHKQVSFGGKNKARQFKKPVELVISEEEDDEIQKKKSDESFSISDDWVRQDSFLISV